ncbi:MAG: hypothetical protein PVF93_00870 [Chromatiaceae bacterium]|jgi:hypothetical protein
MAASEHGGMSADVDRADGHAARYWSIACFVRSGESKLKGTWENAQSGTVGSTIRKRSDASFV